MECGGALEYEQFVKLAQGATYTVNAMIGSNAVTSKNRHHYSMAITKLVDRLSDPTSKIASERVGDTAVTYGVDHTQSDEEYVRTFLAGSGLLYAGL